VPQTGNASAARSNHLRIHPCAERTAVAPLSDDTPAQIIWYRGDYQIRIASWLPLGVRAAVVRHLSEAHLYSCCTRYCDYARAWVAEARAVSSVAEEADGAELLA
jgi:hypothetical protein